MNNAEQYGNEIIDTAESVHFIPTGGGAEWSLTDMIKMKVGTTLDGIMRIRTQSDTDYLEGTMVVHNDGLQFEPT